MLRTGPKANPRGAFGAAGGGGGQWQPSGAEAHGVYFCYPRKRASIRKNARSMVQVPEWLLALFCVLGPFACSYA